ncbi:MAG: isoprenylcysteine carboxylmethyltransferase family protein [Candidatus Lokiarchaeota archaeon]|nr:isoprenylcysteine carboxylmethyltransferase family protein [Candidatus Lokiarchaeota archaeon]
MSVPLVSYLAFFFQYPNILLIDIQFLTSSYGFNLVLFGFILFIYTVVYQLTHRKQLMRTGPYKYIRHPQYLAFIIMTLGMTLVAFQTGPVFDFPVYNVDGHTIIFLIWIGEVLAYIFLGKIEELALKTKYGDEFLEYANDVSFMFPFLKLKRNKIEKN